MLRVCAYCRVSTDKSDQANSFESQRRYFREYIERNPEWQLYRIYADEGISGTSTKKRKEFSRMIAAAKNNCFDLILTKEVSRFARNTLDTLQYTRELKKYGVGVVFLTDNINTLDPDAELRLTIMSSLAQEESRRTSERVKWGQHRRMEQGVVFGRDLLGYHVHDGKLYINEGGAKIVRLIFHKFAEEGKGTSVIARELREAGIETLSGQKKWTNTEILRILRNEKYCGDLVQKKTYTPDFLTHQKKYNRGAETLVVLKNHHEAIVSRELFGLAQQELLRRSPNKGQKYSRRYCFSGKIRCGSCGSAFVSRTKQRKDGSRSVAWRCREAVLNGTPRTDESGRQIGCTNGKQIRNEVILLCVRQILRKMSAEQLFTADLAEILSAVLTQNRNAEKKNLQSELDLLLGKKDRLLDLYAGQEITREEYLRMAEKYERETRSLEAENRKEQNRQACGNDAEKKLGTVLSAMNALADGTREDDTFFRSLVEKIVVCEPDSEENRKIEISFKFLPALWTCNVPEHFDASVPISVSVAFTSS